MRQFILQSVAAIFLSSSILYATEAMAKSTGMRCNQCHKGRNPILGIKPKLKSKGIRHLVKLITVEGYVPKYNYSKLNYLAATIEANRKKLEAPKKTAVKNSESADIETLASKPDGTDKISKETDLSKGKSANAIVDKNIQKQEISSLGDSNSSEPKSSQSKTATKDYDKTLVNKKESKINIQKSTKNSHEVITDSKGKVQFKGGKTFILKRPKVKPGTKYDWEQDWSFDDYY